ncbi:MAG: hypothetical protein ABI769_04850 [Pseudomonadota bacterium]
MKLGKPQAIFLTTGLYIVLTIAGYLYFSWARNSFASAPSARFLLALAGPSLSLRTHMSYVLYGLQSLILIPLMIIGVLSTRFRTLAWVAFAIAWLLVGWRMYALF